MCLDNSLKIHEEILWLQVSLSDSLENRWRCVPCLQLPTIYMLILRSFLSRTAEGSSKKTQKDMHCENGRDTEPVEEHCRPLRQLVSVSVLLSVCFMDYAL